jgi:hypothetical protein
MMTLLLQLQVRGQASGKEPAKQLEVSESARCSGMSRLWLLPGYRCAPPDDQRVDTAWTAATAPG